MTNVDPMTNVPNSSSPLAENNEIRLNSKIVEIIGKIESLTDTVSKIESKRSDRKTRYESKLWHETIRLTNNDPEEQKQQRPFEERLAKHLATLRANIEVFYKEQDWYEAGEIIQTELDGRIDGKKGKGLNYAIDETLSSKLDEVVGLLRQLSKEQIKELLSKSTYQRDVIKIMTNGFEEIKYKLKEYGRQLEGIKKTGVDTAIQVTELAEGQKAVKEEVLKELETMRKKLAEAEARGEAAGEQIRSLMNEFEALKEKLAKVGVQDKTISTLLETFKQKLEDVEKRQKEATLENAGHLVKEESRELLVTGKAKTQIDALRMATMNVLDRILELAKNKVEEVFNCLANTIKNERTRVAVIERLKKAIAGVKSIEYMGSLNLKLFSDIVKQELVRYGEKAPRFLRLVGERIHYLFKLPEHVLRQTRIIYKLPNGKWHAVQPVRVTADGYLVVVSFNDKSINDGEEVRTKRIPLDDFYRMDEIVIMIDEETAKQYFATDKELTDKELEKMEVGFEGGTGNGGGGTPDGGGAGAGAQGGGSTGGTGAQGGPGGGADGSGPLGGGAGTAGIPIEPVRADTTNSKGLFSPFNLNGFNDRNSSSPAIIDNKDNRIQDLGTRVNGINGGLSEISTMLHNASGFAPPSSSIEENISASVLTFSTNPALPTINQPATNQYQIPPLTRVVSEHSDSLSISSPLVPKGASGPVVSKKISEDSVSNFAYPITGLVFKNPALLQIYSLLGVLGMMGAPSGSNSQNPNNDDKNQHPDQKNIYSHPYSLFSNVAIIYALIHNNNPNTNTLGLKEVNDWLITIAAKTILPNSYNAVANPFLWLSVSLITAIYITYAHRHNFVSKPCHV